MNGETTILNLKNAQGKEMQFLHICLFLYLKQPSCTKENKSIKDLDIFDNLLLYRVYADNTAFF